MRPARGEGQPLCSLDRRSMLWRPRGVARTGEGGNCRYMAKSDIPANPSPARRAMTVRVVHDEPLGGVSCPFLTGTPCGGSSTSST